ncbi:MAG: hypothetical protein OEY63_06045 [Gemmatimonadota bacterium]|nr:hypothetical protein [Gemmatimonadota bacterium]
MRTYRIGFALVILASILLTNRSQAQVIPELQEGIEAYGSFDFETAIQLLEIGLGGSAIDLIGIDEWSRLKTYVAAAHFYLGNEAQASEAFREILLANSSFTVDEIIFPPEISEMAGSVRAILMEIPDTFARGIRSYDDFDLVGAATDLRRVLLIDTLGQLSREERIRALAYLGAAESFRGLQDSAISAFRRLVQEDPNYRLDRQTFSPEITQLHTAVGRQVTMIRDLIASGKRAYDEFDFDQAIWRLNRAVESGGAEQLEIDEYGSAMTYMAASNFFNGDVDAAMSIFRKLALKTITHRIDDLVFPPDVAQLYRTAVGEVQAARDLFRQGVASYNGRNFNNAVAIFGRVLQPGIAVRLPADERADALAYYAASQAFRGDRNSALSLFRTLIAQSPQYDIQGKGFSDGVVQIYVLARQQIAAVQVRPPESGAVALGESEFSLWVKATTPHQVSVELARADGTPVRNVFQGVIADSVQVRWDGRDDFGDFVSDGRDQDGVVSDPGEYRFAFKSHAADGRVLRQITVPVHFDIHIQDTLPHPPPPADSLYLPTRRAPGPGLNAIMGGLVGGISLAVLPSIMAPNYQLSPGRFAVGGAIGLAGMFGLVKQMPGGTLRANVQANDAIRQAWRNRVSQVAESNALLLSEPYMLMHFGDVSPGGAQ